MTYDRRQIRELTTASEYELVAASSADALRKLTKKALQSNIKRTRNLRDKQRDLLRRQKLKSRARTGSKHAGNERTAQKAEIFDDTLGRFTKRLQTLNAKPKAATKAKAKATAANKGPKSAPKGAGRKAGQTALRQKARTPRMQAIQGHVGSRVRRAQARRDSR